MATFISKLWNKISSKRPPLSVMIIGLDVSGKTSILNTLVRSTPNSTAASSKNVSTIKQSPDDDGNNEKTPLSDSSQQLSSFAAAPGDHERSSPSVEPTIGYNYERFRYRGRTINLLDFSGQSRYRGLWQEFFNCVDGILFVIDSSDLIRLVVVQDELETVLNHPFFATLMPDVRPKLAITTTSNNDNTRTAQITAQQLVQRQVVIEQGKLIQSPLSDWPKAATPQRGASSDGRRGNSRTKIPILFMANKSDLATSVDTQVVVEAVKLHQVPSERHPWHIQATSVRTNQGIIEGFDWLIDEILRTN